MELRWSLPIAPALKFQHCGISVNNQSESGEYCGRLDRRLPAPWLAVESAADRTGREDGCHSVLDALPAAIYTTDAAGRITSYNRAAAELAGRRPELGTDKWCVTWRLYRLQLPVRNSDHGAPASEMDLWFRICFQRRDRFEPGDQDWPDL